MTRRNKAFRNKKQRKPKNRNNDWYSIEDDTDTNKNLFETFENNSKRKQIIITPRSENQRIYLNNLQDPNTYITICVGPAGTGKTMLATQIALKGLVEGLYEKIIITRPAVTADEELGFLPGDINKKMNPFILPILDVLEEYSSPKEVQTMIKDKKICVEPFAYMRGRTFKNSFIIVDEMQNSTPEQGKMLLTRIGEGSKMVITGDLQQHDRSFRQNGLLDFITRIERQPNDSIQVCKFDNSDICRHPIIDHILMMYDESLTKIQDLITI